MGSSERQLRIATALILWLALFGGQADAWWLLSGAQTSGANATAAPPAQAQTRQEARAVARFDLAGVKGTFSFSQRSAGEPTRVEYDLLGLRGNNRLYHVHVRPVPQHDHAQARHNASLAGQLCADSATGGHLNPLNVSEKLPPKSAPLDKYEIGDLSGKHGPLLELAGQPDRYVGAFQDDTLPMSGPHSIVGRSIVIHQNDGKRWVCASITPA